MYCDLHTHSTFSDGTWTPTQIVLEAKKQNLIVALTDHNTVDGLSEFMSAGKQYNHPVVPGVEITTEWEGHELHLVGLFIPQESMPALHNFLQAQQLRKEQSLRDMIQRLRDASYDIDYESIKNSTPNGNINRANIATALLEKQYVTSVTEAFNQLLEEKHGFYKPAPRLPLFEIIRMLRDLQALPVLAHPLKELSKDTLCTLLPLAIKEGLRGIETFHSDYTEEQIHLARQIAKQFELLESGGSDFHGKTKPDIQLGIGKGNLQIPEEIYHKLPTN